MDEKQLQLLYDVYGKSQDFKDYDEFKSLMLKESSRKVFFDNANEELGFKDYDEFNSLLGVSASQKKKDVQSESTPQEPVSDLEQKTQVNPDQDGMSVTSEPNKKDKPLSEDERKEIELQQVQDNLYRRDTSVGLDQKMFNKATTLTEEDLQQAEQNVTDKLQGSAWETFQKKSTGVINAINRFIPFTSKLSVPDTYKDKIEKEAVDYFDKQEQWPTKEKFAEKIKEIALRKETENLKAKKVEDYVSGMTEEQRKDFSANAIYDYKTIELEEKAKMLELTMANKKFETLNSRAESYKSALEKIQSEGKEVGETLINDYSNLIEERNNALTEYKNNYESFVKKIDENQDKKIDIREGIDMVKRNYGFIDNMRAQLAMATAELWDAGAKGFGGYVANIGGETLNSKTLKDLSKNLTESAIETKVLTEEVAQGYKQRMEYDQINGLSDVGYFITQETVNQVPVLTAIMNPASSTLGIVGLGASTAGGKFTEMKMEEQNGVMPKDFSLAQEIAVPFGYGVAEAVLGALPTSRILNRTVKDVTQRQLLKEGAKKYVNTFIQDNAMEVATETATTLSQNIIDRYALNDKTVQLTDNLDQTAFATLASSPFITGGTKISAELIRPFLPKDKTEAIKKSYLKTLELQKAYNETTNEGTKAFLDKQLNEEESNRKELQEGLISDVQNLSKEQYDEIKDIAKKQAILQAEAQTIDKDKSLPKDQRKKFLEEMVARFNTLEDRRIELINSKPTSKPQQNKLDIPENELNSFKDQASNELIAEKEKAGEAEYEITDEEITQRAIEISERNEDKSGTLIEAKKSDIEKRRSEEQRKISEETKDMSDDEIVKTSGDRIKRRVAVKAKYDAEIAKLEAKNNKPDDKKPPQTSKNKQLKPVEELQEELNRMYERRDNGSKDTGLDQQIQEWEDAIEQQGGKVIRPKTTAETETQPENAESSKEYINPFKYKPTKEKNVEDVKKEIGVDENNKINEYIFKPGAPYHSTNNGIHAIFSDIKSAKKSVNRMRDMNSVLKDEELAGTIQYLEYIIDVYSYLEKISETKKGEEDISFKEAVEKISKAENVSDTFKKGFEARKKAMESFLNNSKRQRALINTRQGLKKNIQKVAEHLEKKYKGDGTKNKTIDEIKKQYNQKFSESNSAESNERLPLSKNPAVEEINNLPLTRIEGLKMGASQAEGTYVSTEKTGNRYKTLNPNAKVSQVSVNVKNPLVVTDDTGLVDMRNTMLNENKDQFTAEDFEMVEVPNSETLTIDDLNDTGIAKLSKMVTKDLKEQGYDSIYFPESKNQEGELVVFDRKNVTQLKPKNDGQQEKMQDQKDEQAEKQTEEQEVLNAEVQSFADELSDQQEDLSDISKGSLQVQVGDTKITLNQKDKNIIIESVATPDNQRGKGSARKAMQKVVDVADKQSKTLELDVKPLDDKTTTEGLISLYESFGFKKVKGSDTKMVREPQAKGEQKVKPKKQKKAEVAKKPETEKGTVVKIGKIEYTVLNDGTGQKVFNSKGKTPSKPTARKVLKKFAQNNYDFTKGERYQAKEEDRDQDYDMVIANNSKNPAELAEIALKTQTRQFIESKIPEDIQDAILAMLGNVKRGKVDDPGNDGSFINQGDVNYITNAIGRSYLKKNGMGLDVIAQDLLDNKFTPDELVTIIRDYPNGINDLEKEVRDQYSNPAKSKFTELTGFPASDFYLEEAVKQENKRLEQELELQENALSFLTEAELNVLYQNSLDYEKSIIERSQRSDENADIKDGKKEPRVQKSSDVENKDSRQKEKITKQSDDAFLDWFDSVEKKLDDFGKENLSIGLPVVIAKETVKIVRAAYKAGKTAAQAIKEALDYIKSTDWYKSLSKSEQKEINGNVVKQVVVQDNRSGNQTKVQSQGITGKKEIRDPSLSEGGPVEQDNEWKKRAIRFWNQTFKTNAGADKTTGRIVRSLNRELSAITNTLEHELNEINKILKSSKKRKPSDFRKNALAINEYLHGVEGVDISFLTPKQIEKLDAMRDRVDMLSDKLIQLLDKQKLELENKLDEYKEGGVAHESILEALERVDKLRETIELNKGKYLYRSYEAFRNDKYLERLTSKRVNKEGKRRIKNAVEFIMAENDISEKEARVKLFEYLESLKNRFDLVDASAMGSADAPFLKKRQEIPKVFRELLGESNDPLLNYASTVFKVSQYIASIEYQNRLKDYVLNSGIGTYEAQEGYTKLTPDGNNWKALNGVYVPVEFYDAIQDLQPLDAITDNFYKAWVGFAAFTKLGKTVLSPTTVMRNVYSGVFLGLNAGFFFASRPQTTIDAFKMAWGTKKSRKELKSETEKLYKLGILGDGAVSQEVMETVNDFSTSLERITNRSNFRIILNGFKKLYAIGDDFYKVIGYYTYLKRYQKSGLSKSEAETKAAQRVVDTFPTYSMLPKNIQKLRRVPLVGTFVSFPYEVVRTTANGFKYMKEDLEAGRTSMFYKQAAGMFLAQTTLLALGELSKSMIGFNDDDDDKIRDMLPEWQTNSKLVYTGKDKYGNPEFIDGTALFPSEVIQKPLRTLLKSREGRDLDEQFTQSIDEALSPYLGFDISFKTMNELFFNKDVYNRKIYEGENLVDGVFNDPEKIMQHYLKNAGPGVYTNFTEFARANELGPEYFGDKYTSYGREYTNKDALLGLLGFRFTTLNYVSGMQSLGYQNKGELDDKKTTITSNFKTTRRLDNKDIEKAVKEYAEISNKTSKSMIIAIKGARKLGVSELKIKESLSVAGFTQEDVKALMNGIPMNLKETQSAGLENQIKRIELNYNDPKKATKLELNYLDNLIDFNILIKEYNNNKMLELFEESL